jgi:rubrerythrin
MTRFYTKDKKVRPITKRRMHVGSMQTGVAHLGVPRRISENYRTQKLAKIQEKALEAHTKQALKELPKNMTVREYYETLSPEQKEEWVRIGWIGYIRKYVPTKISKSEKKAEVAMVKDEAEGEAEYLHMADVADKEGRHETAETFRRHAKDEQKHKIEDKAIVQKANIMNNLQFKNVNFNELTFESQAIYKTKNNAGNVVKYQVAKKGQTYGILKRVQTTFQEDASFAEFPNIQKAYDAFNEIAETN